MRSVPEGSWEGDRGEGGRRGARLQACAVGWVGLLGPPRREVRDLAVGQLIYHDARCIARGVAGSLYGTHELITTAVTAQLPRRVVIRLPRTSHAICVLSPAHRPATSARLMGAGERARGSLECRRRVRCASLCRLRLMTWRCISIFG